MKLLFPIFCALLLLSFGVDDVKPKILSIEQVILNPNFKVSILSNGQYSGKSIQLKVVSKNKKDVEVMIPAGTLFYTSDESEQILITTDEVLLAVTKMRTKNKTLDGYCTESSDRAPSTEAKMAFKSCDNEKLLRLVDFINKHPALDHDNIQEAVWCITNRNSISNIFSDKRKSVVDLKKEVASIMGVEIPWHELKRSLGTSDDGYVMPEPVMVKGEIEFETTKDVVLQGKIVDLENNELYTYPYTFTIPKTKSAMLEFNLEVQGWGSGKYFVVYADQDGKEYLKKEFTL
ncbi:MAG: hypothetical protein JKY54_03100 [Flavobacteriales bacterium]|nr:hypothetical protein [Flavobacteriales bacterium]